MYRICPRRNQKMLGNRHLFSSSSTYTHMYAIIYSCPPPAFPFPRTPASLLRLNFCWQLTDPELLMVINKPSGSSSLLQGVHGVQLVDQLTFEGSDETAGSSQRFVLGGVWQQRLSCLTPIHCGRLHVGDQNVAETIANIVTSLPFVVLGLQAPRKNLNTALYANSLIGVGIASSLYHCSRGQVRKFLRWADYTMIAATTVCLSRALRNENPKLLMAASTLVLPFQPFMVSAVHTGLMEVAFARRAVLKPELKMAYNLHTLSSLLGGALFIADELFTETPYIHAAWHLAAAIGVGTCNKLLE